jgi:hypothetical protein
MCDEQLALQQAEDAFRNAVIGGQVFGWRGQRRTWQQQQQPEDVHL